MDTAVAAARTVGFYCGRFGPGLLGEPLNSFSNLAFVAGAAVAWFTWRANPARDPWQLLLFILMAFIGVGSFVFHSAPTPATLVIDLLPIQIFGLACLFYVCLRYLNTSATTAIAIGAAFLLLRQGWIAIAPKGALGGAITHLPSLAVLVAAGLVLLGKRMAVGRYLLAAAVAYASAIAVRTWDLAVCRDFPIGLHWLWHLLTAITAFLLVYGVVKAPPPKRAGDDR